MESGNAHRLYILLHWFIRTFFFVFLSADSVDSSTRSTSKSSTGTKYSDSYGSSSKDTIIQVGSIQTSLDEICRITGNFSPANKIGEGAFGAVYRAKLEDGPIVAVKRAKKAIPDD